MILDVIAELCVACGGPLDTVPNLVGSGAAGSSGGPPPSEPPPDPSAEDIAESVGTGLATDIALDIASKRLPASSGLLGVLGTLVSGSATLAEGITAVHSSNGYGRGGASTGGKESMEEAFRHIRGEDDPRLKKSEQ